MIKDVLEAAAVLGLDNHASLNVINSRYKELLHKWHPDHSGDNSEKCREMTIKIIAAYKILMKYCHNYRFSFLPEDMQSSTATDKPEEFWEKKFGHDPLWGYPE